MSLLPATGVLKTGQAGRSKVSPEGAPQPPPPWGTGGGGGAGVRHSSSTGPFSPVLVLGCQELNLDIESEAGPQQNGPAESVTPEARGWVPR